MYINYRWV